MWTKKIAAKLPHLSGYTRIVRKYLFHSYGALGLSVVKVYGSLVDIVLDYMKSNVWFVQFTKPQNIPLGPRILWSIKRSIMWLLGCSLPCPYPEKSCDFNWNMVPQFTSITRSLCAYASYWFLNLTDVDSQQKRENNGSSACASSSSGYRRSTLRP
jgi:hypothetical protein